MPAARARSRLADPLPEAKPRADAYVGLLALSLIAMVVGTVFLALDYMEYSGTPVPTPAKYTAPVPPAPQAPSGGTPVTQ